MTVRAKVGFIGLGRMGAGMAANLQKAGIDLTVFDPQPATVEHMVALGAKSATSIADLAQQVDVVFTSLPDPAEFEAVVFGESGILENLRAGMVHFDLTSNAREMALRAHQAYAAKDARFLDAPVSGGPAGARSGNLVLWIGGCAETVAEHMALLTTFSQPHYVGPIGAGSVTKLAHNLLGYTIMEAQAEAFTLAVKAGIDPLDFWSALRLGVVGKQPPIYALTQQFLPYEFEEAAFAQKLALKDVRLALALAQGLDVPMRLSSMMAMDMEAVVARGEGEGDSRSFLKLQVERAAVSIKVPRDRIEAAMAEAATREMKG